MQAFDSSFDHTSLSIAAREWVVKMFKEHHQPYLHYHNLEHTQQVVTRSLAIAKHYHLNETQCAILETAAWFHDTGHLFGPTMGHEEVGVARFYEFLQTIPTYDIPVELIVACILSTKMPQTPAHFLEGIICDADTFNLGTSHFVVTDAQLKKEVTERMGALPLDWEQKTLDLLQTHCYHTHYCRELLDEGKRFNYTSLLHRVKPSSALKCS